MSFRGIYSLCNHIKDGYIVRRPDIGALIDDASVRASKRRQTAGQHETESADSRLNRASSEPTEWSAEGGQRSSESLSSGTKRLNLGNRVLRRLLGERVEAQPANNSQDILLPPIRSSVSSTGLRINAEGRASIWARTERDPVVVASLDEEPCGLPPPYSLGPVLPSYDIVIEEEWRRIRSLRRRTLGHPGNTATNWRRSSLSSAFFDRQPGERRRSRLEAHE